MHANINYYVFNSTHKSSIILHVNYISIKINRTEKRAKDDGEFIHILISRELIRQSLTDILGIRIVAQKIRLLVTKYSACVQNSASSSVFQTNLGSRYYYGQLQRTKLRLRESRHLA